MADAKVNYAPDGVGGEQDDNAGDTGEDADEAAPQRQQLPGLPDMVGQDGKPLFVPIRKAKGG